MRNTSMHALAQLASIHSRGSGETGSKGYHTSVVRHRRVTNSTECLLRLRLPRRPCFAKENLLRQESTFRPTVRELQAPIPVLGRRTPNAPISRHWRGQRRQEEGDFIILSGEGASNLLILNEEAASKRTTLTQMLSVQ